MAGTNGTHVNRNAGSVAAQSVFWGSGFAVKVRKAIVFFDLSNPPRSIADRPELPVKSGQRIPPNHPFRGRTRIILPHQPDTFRAVCFRCRMTELCRGPATCENVHARSFTMTTFCSAAFVLPLGARALIYEVAARRGGPAIAYSAPEPPHQMVVNLAPRTPC